MNDGQNSMTQQEADRLCRAASAVYYRVARSHADRTGQPVLLPELLCPEYAAPDVLWFDKKTIAEAEAFLVRLGVIGISTNE